MCSCADDKSLKVFDVVNFGKPIIKLNCNRTLKLVLTCEIIISITNATISFFFMSVPVLMSVSP